MIRILLACAGGMSTSLLMTKIETEAEKQGIEVTVEAHPESEVEDLIGTFDVLLLGPQVRYVLPAMKKMLANIAPVEVINMQDYGTMNGAKVLETALNIYREFHK